MTLTPHDLLDVSIAQLNTLASFLAEEMGAARERVDVVTPEVRACEEILLTISVLIPKLQAALYVMPREAMPSTRARGCEGCEEG
jgi:hypothetical protein